MPWEEDLGYLRARVDSHDEKLCSIEGKVDTLLVEFQQRKGAVKMLIALCTGVGALVSWLVALVVGSR